MKAGAGVKVAGGVIREGELKLEVHWFKKWQVQWLLPWKNGEKIARVMFRVRV